MCAIEVFVWKRVCAGQAPVRSLALKISVIFGHTDKSSLIHLSLCALRITTKRINTIEDMCVSMDDLHEI